MSAEQARYDISKLKKRYLLLRLFEITLLASGTVLLTLALAGLWASASILTSVLSFAAGSFVFVVRLIHYKLHKLDSGFFTSYLNRHYPQLKESADLLLGDENNLTSLQQLQKIQTLRQFDTIYPEIKLPHHVAQSGGIFAGCLIVYFALSAFGPFGRKDAPHLKVDVEPVAGDTTSVVIRTLNITITPPSYTQLGSFVAPGANLVFPEGSTVSWQAEFSGDAKNVKIIFSGRDSLNFEKQSPQAYTVHQLISESGFYQLQWSVNAKTQRSDYFKIEVIKDQPPKIGISNLSQFTKLPFTGNLKVDVKSSIGDDYGLKDAEIIATVSKGSGEAVKFREEKLRFTTPEKIAGKQVLAAVTLNLRNLRLEPGDELYFYVEAFDNKAPIPNHNRTETFFISLQDTASEIISADAGLGVDLMPEYFRSQRQIIIDTEKLLREKKKLTKSVFNATSNELGYDQKVLRLRYGQFLGEEADPGIGQEIASNQIVQEEDKEGEKETDVTKPFEHQHDTKNEHNLVDQKKNLNKGQSHEAEQKDPEEKEDPTKAFTHEHDSNEEATFFDQSIKAKLKAALTIMWDAELYLRLYEPEKSLPYQYKVLNLLKEISNDSRIYVHRSGFDPPPLKEDKRLTADLAEIKTSANQYAAAVEEVYPGIRQALLTTENMILEKTTDASPEAQKIFTKAGSELAVVAIEQPGIYLRSLSLLKLLAEQKVKAVEMDKTLREIRATLWKVLPQQTLSPVRPGATAQGLDQNFLKSLEKLRHE